MKKTKTLKAVLLFIFLLTSVPFVSATFTVESYSPVNLTPTIKSYSGITFSVSLNDTNVSINWTVDGTLVQNNGTFTFETADYPLTQHTVNAILYDVDSNQNITWETTLLDNYPVSSQVIPISLIMVPSMVLFFLVGLSLLSKREGGDS